MTEVERVAWGRDFSVQKGCLPKPNKKETSCQHQDYFIQIKHFRSNAADPNGFMDLAWKLRNVKNDHFLTSTRGRKTKGETQ